MFVRIKQIMAELSERERIYLLMMKGYEDNIKRSYQETCNLFNATFNARNPISKSTVVKTFQRFIQTGSVKDRPRSGRFKSVSNDEKSLDILQSFIETPNTSIRKVVAEHEVDQQSVHNILEKHKYYPYKVQYVQELVKILTKEWNFVNLFSLAEMTSSIILSSLMKLLFNLMEMLIRISDIGVPKIHIG